MIMPPSVTEANERAKLTSKKRQRSNARISSSKATTAIAKMIATLYVGIRNGSVCRMPPTKVPAPVIDPRTNGFPRPVSSPVSDSPSEKAMLMPAPIAVAIPAMKASNGLCVWIAIAKIGARVDRDPSIKPVIAGCTRWSRKVCRSVMSRVYQSKRKPPEHKARLTNIVRGS